METAGKSGTKRVVSTGSFSWFFLGPFWPWLSNGFWKWLVKSQEFASPAFVDVCVCVPKRFFNVFCGIYIYIQYVCYIYTYVYIFIEIISVSISLCAFIFWSVFLNLSTFLCCFLYLPSAYQYLSTPSLRPSIYPLPIYLLFFSPINAFDHSIYCGQWSCTGSSSWNWCFTMLKTQQYVLNSNVQMLSQ